MPVNSYRTHVGRELEMMLSGLKPLAMFYGDADSEADERIIPEQRFSSYVEKGEFAKGELILEYAVDPRTNRPVKVRYVFYALVSEQWRIEAMRLAIEVMSKMGRADEGLDRIMGTLLGHSAEEIDEFVSKHKRQ
jgi:hypothetical protein